MTVRLKPAPTPAAKVDQDTAAAKVYRNCTRRAFQARLERLLSTHGYNFVNAEGYWWSSNSGLRVMVDGPNWIAGYDDLIKPKYEGLQLADLALMLEEHRAGE